MNWINVKDKHFVDITYKGNGGSYEWVENNNCPQEPFLVALRVGNNQTRKYTWEKYMVILTEYGLREVADGDDFYFGWEVTDVEYWCKVEAPE